MPNLQSGANVVDEAIDRGRRVLLQRRAINGGFPDRTDIGPSYTALPLIAMTFAGCAPSAADIAKIVQWLRRQQRGDGGYVAYPFATDGDLCATAAVWAALKQAGVPDSDDAVQRAATFMNARGGLPAVAQAFFGQTNFAALFVAMAGYLEPSLLPMPPSGLFLAKPIEKFLREHFDYLTLIGALVACSAIVEKLKRDAPEPPAHSGVFGELASVFARAVAHAAIDFESIDDRPTYAFLEQYQNPNGSLDETTLQTALLVAAYHALESSVADAANGKRRAADWLRAMLITSTDEAWFSGFTGDVWSTALAGRALLTSGTRLDDQTITSMVNWFLDCQILDGTLVRTTPGPHGVKIGGWAFESGNVTMPDCDDTGLVLATLGMAANQSTGQRGDKLDATLSARTLTAIETGCRYLEGMQNPDGGWTAFDYWNGPSKPRGPLYTQQIGLVTKSWVETLRNLTSPPIGLGSPSWEDVTGRVLLGLGNARYNTDSPVVQNALAFLRAQQLDHGGWWGRWMVNYLPTTACIVLGFAAVDLPLDDPMLRRACEFLSAHQNADGGWGETELSYIDPQRAGTGPSMAPLTGLVLSALIDAGEGNSEVVARGIAFLIKEQRSDGTWPNDDWLHAFFPPQSFYCYYMMPQLYPLEALGRFRLWQQQRRADIDTGNTTPSSTGRIAILDNPPALNPVPGAARFNDALLDRMRQEADPIADAVIQNLFANNSVDAVRALLMQLIRSDDPIPEGMPTVARDYFEQTEVLPSWADPAQIKVAESLFARIGWSVAASLFCASLPQTYAAAKGAKVLLYSGRLDKDVRRRILETAQFIFDVTDHNGMTPGGRGVRTTQKVRLMHGTLRHLTLQQASWSLDDGLPINQEDLGATLCAFSSIILEALDRFQIEISPPERVAWMHVWKVVGAILGVDAALLPDSEADGRALMDAVRRRHWRASPQGELLGKALCDCMAAYMPTRVLQRLPPTLVRHLAGDQCADILKLPQADWTSILVDAAGDFLDVFSRDERNHTIGNVLNHFSGELMKEIILVQRDGKQAPFRIPESLRST